MWESGQDRAPGHDDVNCEGGCRGEKRARHLERPEFYVMVPALSIHPPNQPHHSAGWCRSPWRKPSTVGGWRSCLGPRRDTPFQFRSLQIARRIQFSRDPASMAPEVRATSLPAVKITSVGILRMP